MENTVIGNLCADPTLRVTRRTGRPMIRFTVAVNQRRRLGEQFVDQPPVFHRIVCFGPQAENANNTLRKGMEVLVVGEWIDDSYSDEQGQKHSRIAMEAKVIGAGLRWASATVTKVDRGRLFALPDPPSDSAPSSEAMQVPSQVTSPDPATPPDPVASPRPVLLLSQPVEESGGGEVVPLRPARRAVNAGPGPDPGGSRARGEQVELDLSTARTPGPPAQKGGKRTARVG